MIRVGVVRSNVANSEDESRKTGSFVISHLLQEPLSQKYKVVDITIDPDGTVYMKGRISKFSDISQSVDVIFNLLNEDTEHHQTFQQNIEQLQIPHTHSSVFTKTLSSNPILIQNIARQLDIKVPIRHIIASYQEDIDGPLDAYAIRTAKSIWSKMSPPWVVKPVSNKTSFGIHVCKTFPELVRSVSLACILETGFIIEELIEGRNAHVYNLSQYRGDDIYTFPPISDTIHHQNFTDQEKSVLQDYSKRLHQAMNFANFSTHNFLIHPKKGIYFVDSKPHFHLYEGSKLQEVFENFGLRIHDAIDHIIQLSLRK